MVISAVMKDLEASKDPKLACNAIAFIFDVVLNPVAVGTIRLFEPAKQAVTITNAAT